jgi:formylmethanofuran dehydrogenase subunit E-like metal-binding protein
MMADYVKKHLPLEQGGSYFVQSVQPWCKEDALLIMLNATPGKGGYAVTYPTEAGVCIFLTQKG